MPNILRLAQICLVYTIIWTTNTIFQNQALSGFSIYDLIQKTKKIHGVDLEKNASQTDRQVDKWMDEQG